MRIIRSAILVLAALLVLLAGCEQLSTSIEEDDALAAPAPSEPGISPAAKLTLGGIVWEDLDRDGLMEVGEPAMAGVSVELLDAAAASFEPAVLAVTGEDGAYLFTELAAGTYFVAFSRPDGYEFSRPDRGDSDANLFGVAGPIELGHAEVSTQAAEVDLTNAGVSVEPVLVLTNPSCATLNADDINFPGIVSGFGFKVDGFSNGTYALTSADGELTGGAPSDPGNSVTISNSDGTYFDWAATLGIDAVIVKGGPDANGYVYTPEAFAGLNLHAPVSKTDENENATYYGISHIEFCYDYALTAEKTATPSYTRTYAWTIEKTVDPASHVGWAGESFDWTYTVTLDRTVKDDGFAVSGEIVVTNPTPFTVDINVGDSVGGVAAVVDCPKTSLAAGESVTCTYTAALDSKTDGTNTATITSENPNVAGATATADYAFGEPTTTVGYEAVNVIDYLDGATGGRLLGEASGYVEFSFGYGGGCPTDEDPYVDGIFRRTFPNVAVIDQTGQQDDASVEMTCYIPTVSKDATATYVERHDWSIEKSVDRTSQSGFLGDTLDWTWTIDVTERVVDQDFRVTGTIYVTNPSQEPVEAMVEDYLGMEFSNKGVVDCDDETEGDQAILTIPALSTGECSYVVEAPNASATVNHAVVLLRGYEYVTPVDVTFEKIVENDTATLTDPALGLSVALTEPYLKSFSGQHVCSSDLADYEDSGSYSGSVTNTATLVDKELSEFSDTTTTSYDCYVPTIEKTAAGTYNERHEWSVEKTVLPLSQAAFIGETVYFDWTITVFEDVYEENFDVSGTITVMNPNPEDSLVVPLTDFVDGVAATIDADSCALDRTHLTVAAGGTETCDYSVSLAEVFALAHAPTLNTATIVLNGVSFEASHAIGYTPNVIRGTATLDDDRFPYSGVDVHDGWTATYEDDYTCSTNDADYTNGVDADNLVSNTAEIFSENVSLGSSTATTVIDCYRPLVTKTASASYVERHTWGIQKSVSPLNQWGYPGDELEWTWTVTVSEGFKEKDFHVFGEISVTNPAGAPEAIKIGISDQLNDGTDATVDCGDGAETVTVAPGTTVICDYDADPTGRTATLNTATATSAIGNFTATANVSFARTIENGTATLTDEQIGLSATVSAGDGPWSYGGSDRHVCSTSYAAYGADGTYSATLDNTATVTGSDGQSDSDFASTTYTCEAGTLTVLKLTNGMETVDQTWAFGLYEGPFGFGGTALYSGATPPALIDFGLPALRLDTTYTLCELEVPAGYSTLWQLGGVTLIPYNPNAAADPPEDLGNRCVDFSPTYAGDEFAFVVDNQMPGGAPRTPGYWKNWNTCTGGMQQYTAEANGGWQEGFWLLEDVLDPTIGGGIIWDDILDDTLYFEIHACQDAVNLLDKRDLDGKKLASDPFFNLATSLLAAQLNFGAGACATADVNDAALEAERLLDSVDFDGYGYDRIPKKSPLAQQANELALYLDLYNNGEFCGDGFE